MSSWYVDYISEKLLKKKKKKMAMSKARWQRPCRSSLRRELDPVVAVRSPWEVPM